MGKRFEKDMGKFKGNKISTNALIAEREKRKMFFKYKKMLKKENKNNPNFFKEQQEKQRISHEMLNSSQEPRSSKGENTHNKKGMSSYKNAQNEYESKLHEKEKQEEVINLYASTKLS
jgi:hypothetical protein